MITLDKLYGAVIYFILVVLLRLKKSPSTSVVVLQRCFAVKVQKRFVDIETSPTFPIGTEERRSFG